MADRNGERVGWLAGWFDRAPWKHPDTGYRRLVLPVYGVFLGSVVWAIWTAGGPAALGLRWWNLAWLLPLTLPLWTVGSRCWRDGEPTGRDPDAGDESP